jgi:hypothetical protein
MFDKSFGTETPIDATDPMILQQWANRDPATRYPILGSCINMFGDEDSKKENDFSPLFLALLDHAPDKRLFLGKGRLHPQGWSGSLADIFIQRKAQIMKLAEHADEQVRAWSTEITPEIDQWIELERGRDRASEESFE